MIGAYVRAVTRNPYGQRSLGRAPYGARLGCPYAVRLGDEQSDRSKYWDLAGQLRQSNARIQALEQQARDLLNAGRPDAQFARMVNEARRQQEQAAEQLTLASRALFGTVPKGLMGLGQFQILGVAAILAGAAVLIAAVWKAISAAEEYYTRNLALQAVVAHPEAAAAIAQVTGGGEPQDFGSWIKSNWPWLALATGGLIFVGKAL